MRVLITTDLYKPLINGVVTSVINLKKGLEERGHEVRILTLSNKTCFDEKEGIYYVASISSGHLYSGTRFCMRLPRDLMNDIEMWNPQIVHSQCEISTYKFARKIATACHAKLIHTYHTIYENYSHYFCPMKSLSKVIVSRVSKHLLNMADTVIAPSHKVASLLSRYGVDSPIAVIPSGIDYDLFSQTPSNRWIGEMLKKYGLDDNYLRLLYVGRLAKEKNVEELLSVVAECKDMPIKLLIVGDGPLRKNLEKKSVLLGISNIVVFAGSVDPVDVWKYYHLGQVFVNASTSEAQGLTYIEAMASGLPMLCQKDTCLNGLIQDDINGWQYQELKDFRSRLSQLINCKSLREKLSTNSALKAKRYSVSKFVEQIIQIYA